MQGRGGTVWALSVDEIEAFRWARHRGFDSSITLAHVSSDALESLGLLHRAAGKTLACPAVLLIGTGGDMLWARVVTTNAERVPHTEILGAISTYLAT